MKITRSSTRGALTHRVDRDGVVTYQLRGVDIMSDEGSSLRVWDTADDAIENALRLAVQKFGADIKLDGPGHFQAEAARVAAERRIFVRFEEARLNELMNSWTRGGPSSMPRRPDVDGLSANTKPRYVNLRAHSATGRNNRAGTGRLLATKVPKHGSRILHPIPMTKAWTDESVRAFMSG
ncbi:hypothetical protein PT2222_540007 [Paraburkholderia tropica]